MELTIIEQNGWKKSINPSKAILRIGNGPFNDISLTSAQISPVHLQIQHSPENPSRCTVLNLGSEIEVWHLHDPARFPPYTIFYISNGDEIVLGSYRILFTLPFVAQTVIDSLSIKASLSFPDATLRPNAAAVGILTLQNSGPQSACQFEISSEGFSPDCIQIDPVPILYPGAQEKIQIHLFHYKRYPSAGAQELTLTVSSPASYPGEEVVIRQGIFVAPVIEHTLEIIDDLAIEASPEQTKETMPIKIPAMPASGEVTKISSASAAPAPSPIEVPRNIPKEPVKGILSLEPEVESRATAWKEPQETPQEAAQIKPPPSQETKIKEKKPETLSEQDRPKPKVVRHLSDDFWDEGTG